jgi:spore photoproduct lyase
MLDQLKGFQRMLISSPAREHEFGEKVLRLFERAGLPVEELPDDDAVLQHPEAVKPKSLLVLCSPEMGWITEAECGILATRLGEHYLNPIVGCRFGCTYCYLLDMPHGRRPLRLYVATDDLLTSLGDNLNRDYGTRPRLFCTGELADSLAELDLYPVAAVLAEYFGGRDDSRLELRTKSNNVAGLLDIEHRGNTTVAFSISPQEHVTAYEPGTASLLERIEAGRQCQEAGYPVALKLEPLIFTHDWQKRYAETVELIASRLDMGALHHVSVGCLRWSEGLAAVPIFARRHAETIESGTWIEYRPGKYNGTVALSERMAAYEWMRNLLRGHGFMAPIWWSLEEPELIAEMERRDH